MYYNDCISLFKSYIASYCSKETISYYDIGLDLFNRYLINNKGSLDFDVSELTKYDYVGYIAYQRTRQVKNTSVRTYARSVKVFLRYLWTEDLIENNITVNVKMPKSDKRSILPLNCSNVDDVVTGIQKSTMCERNMLIFRLMLDCGLRRSEVIHLNVDDINIIDDYIKIIDSKNNKSRLLPLPYIVKQCFLDYMIVRNGNIKALILLDNGCRITDKAINDLFARLKKYSDVNIYPHLLRHTFATSFILGGGSLEILRVLMGHSGYDVTKEYLHISQQVSFTGIDIYKLDDVFFKTYSYRKGD